MSADVTSDADLLRRFVREGDQGAFGVLVEKHARLVVAACRRTLCNEQDVEDAFQTTFIILAEKAESIRIRDSIVTWLFTVAKRTSKTIATRNAKRRQAESKHYRKSAKDVFEQIRRQELFDTVCKELEGLPNKYKAPLLLCVIGGMTRQAAAEELNCTEATIKARLSRGREMLRSRLSKRNVMPGVLLGVIGIPAVAPPTAELVKQTVSVCAAHAAELYPATSIFSSLLSMKEGAVNMVLSIFGKQGFAVFSVVTLACFVICLMSFGNFRKANRSVTPDDSIELRAGLASLSENQALSFVLPQEGEDAKEAMPLGAYTLVLYQGESPHMTYAMLESKEGTLQLIQQGLEASPLQGKIEGDKVEFHGTRESAKWGKGPLELVGKISGENKDRVIGKWNWKVNGEEVQSGELKILRGKWDFGSPKVETI